MQTSSRNGFGTKLLFHRSMGKGLFEATVWITAMYVPLFPRSTWLVRPQGMKQQSISGGTSTTYFVEFLERRRASLLRILSMYLSVAGALVAMWGPLILTLVMNEHGSLKKGWVGGLLFGLSFVWPVVMWLGLDYRRDRLYKKAVEQQTGSESRSYLSR